MLLEIGLFARSLIVIGNSSNSFPSYSLQTVFKKEIAGKENLLYNSVGNLFDLQKSSATLREGQGQ